MPTLRSLRGTFHRALTAAMVSSPVVSLGCGETVDSGIEGDPNFVPIRCDGDEPLWLADLTPEPPADFVELVTHAGSVTTGEACRTATDKVTCQGALDALPIPGFPPLAAFPIASYVDNTENAVFHVTRGDTVFAVVTFDDLVSFLGEVDTPGEAVLLAAAGGYNVLCAGGGSRPAGDGFEVQAHRFVGCDGRDRYLLSVARDGSIQQVSRTTVKRPTPNCVVGRRPEGLRAAPQPPCRTTGDYLAHAAGLEAASVEAFLRLGAELGAHGAPPELVAAARAAARDEVRHSRIVGRLARRFGAVPEAPRVDPTGARGLESIALENAVEGCVRETFGALAGRWQALHAQDTAIRRAYARIAEDELRHTALSWRVAGWIEHRLDPRARRRVEAARRRAIEALDQELAGEPCPQVHMQCGVPSARQARLLFRRLSATLS